jgi:hypothetical protein
MELAGGCLCGAVRFRVTAEPLAAYYCHCSMCRKISGSIYGRCGGFDGGICLHQG